MINQCNIIDDFFRFIFCVVGIYSRQR